MACIVCLKFHIENWCRSLNSFNDCIVVQITIIFSDHNNIFKTSKLQSTLCIYMPAIYMYPAEKYPLYSTQSLCIPWPIIVETWRTSGERINFLGSVVIIEVSSLLISTCTIIIDQWISVYIIIVFSNSKLSYKVNNNYAYLWWLLVLAGGYLSHHL